MVSLQQALSQCPESNRVLARVIALRDSQVPFVEQKKELLGYILQFQQCQARNDSALVHLLQRTGALSYLLGQYQDAVLYTNDAVQRLKNLAPQYFNMPLMVKMYHYLNIFYDSLHLTANKISAIDSSVFYAINNDLVNNEILNNIMQRVEYSYNIGDYIRCINDAKIADNLNARYGSGQDSVYYEEFFFNYRINSMIELKEVDSAEKMVATKINRFIQQGKKKLCGTLYNQLSRINVRNGKYPEALGNLKLSFECNRLLNYPLGCKQSLNNIGFCYFQYLNDPQSAKSYYAKALTYNSLTAENKDINLVENVNIIGNIANVFAKLNRFDSAFVYFDKAFQLVGKKYNEQRLLNISDDEFKTLPNIHYLTSMVRDKGDAYFQRYKVTGDKKWLDESIAVFRTADKLLTRIKKGQKELLSQLLWRKSAKSIYEHAIEACHEAGRPGDAFYFFERSRAVLLIDKIAINKTASPEALQKLAKIDMKIAELNIRADRMANDSTGVFAIRKNIYDLTTEKDRVSGFIRIADSIKDKQITLADVKKKLSKDATLVELFAGDSSVFILTISSGDQALLKVDKRKYEHLSSAYIAFLSSAEKMNREYVDFINVAHSLYLLIFGNGTQVKTLIVSPDGKYFPFESLVAAVNGNNAEYLVNIAPVSYTYSAKYLSEETNGHERATYQFFGLAPVKYQSSLNLTTLPQSDVSLNNIGAQFSSPVMLTGGKASRSAFLDGYFKYEVVQLYTHATDADNNGEPVIYFADSALRLSELIASQQPATRLIILSACETGSGKWYDGEGVFSFNRSFAEVGVPSAIVNLWSVDNQSTYKLNELFCEYLSHGVASDVALQRAKIQFMKNADMEHRLPFYWAAPIISGHVITLQSAHTGWIWWYSGVMVLAGLTIFCFAIRTGKVAHAAD
jgi:CHAT domain-containing protein